MGRPSAGAAAFVRAVGAVRAAGFPAAVERDVVERDLLVERDVLVDRDVLVERRRRAGTGTSWSAGGAPWTLDGAAPDGAAGRGGSQGGRQG
ncbi:hypothetical protein [Goekera deserti]|uniref:Uncharacterized protein n=1 Tax=Goekera deserti TaxID=2497753 RepID=A0A7K3WG19_9ACTN|nr:hypothetical protein [Goekera deserti]NEL55322.1 hypothetical protein [Goekera deserti]